MQATKPRGRPRKHWAEKVRLLIWYRAVKRCCDWSDYRLDIEFAWLNSEEQAKKPDMHPRTFEDIRKKAQAPARSLDYRSMDQLVLAVDAHPLFEETRDIYDSKIWWLFSQEAIDIEQVESDVASILERFGLMQIRPPYPTGINSLVTRESLKVVSDRCVRLSLEDLPDYTQIELAWYLYVMAQPAHSWGVREAMEIILDNLLDDFFYRHLPDRHFMFYRRACDAMLKARLTCSGSILNAHHKAEAFSKRLVIPKLYADYLSHSSTSTESVAVCLGLF